MSERDSLLEFPCTFPIKVMGRCNSGFEATALAIVRRRCWEYDWVIEFDIKGLFDHINHEWLMRAVRRHCPRRQQFC